MKWNEFIVTGDPMILGAQISIVLVSIGVVALLTYTKKMEVAHERVDFFR